MSVATRYHGYTSYSYLRPDIDYEAFELASELFDRGPYRFDAVLGMRKKRFPSLAGVRDLVKIMWHRASFDSLAERMIPEAGGEVKY